MRMFLYHHEHLIAFISIPCFFYRIIATILVEKFSKQSVLCKILLTIVIIVLTILVSSPFGGMLWHYYDIRYGFFPPNWFWKMVELGFTWGLSLGWLIILLSIPYNIFGSIACYFLTQKGSERFKPKIEKRSTISQMIV